MKIWVYNYHSGKNQSKEMFQNPKLGIGDDLMKPFQVLQNQFKIQWHELFSISEYPISEFDAIIFIEWPTLPWIMNSYFNQARRLKKRMFLLLMESEIIRSSNYTQSHHKYFEKIFTWKDDIVDNKKYIKYNWPQNIPEEIVFSDAKNKKLITLISSHKLNSHPFELYSERIKAIRYFEENAPTDFDLYGGGWWTISFRSNLLKYAPLVPGFSYFRELCQKIFFESFPSWKGRINSKKEILSQYKFAICYENAKNIPWYITEKIFDCFFVGCIPVYLGPPNIDDFIPKNTYIDKNKFPSYANLLYFLHNLTDIEITEYQKNIKLFLESEMWRAFSSQSFAKVIVQNIIVAK